jgi:hypothetical protein
MTFVCCKPRVRVILLTRVGLSDHLWQVKIYGFVVNNTTFIEF